MISSDSGLSVIVPALNEIEALPDNLRALASDPEIDEIIVVDGGSDDGTREFVRRFPGVRLIETDPGRGLQMNTGARNATGEWLLFHHADTRLPAGAARLIKALDPEENVWGGFRHRFSHTNWKLRLVSSLHNFRCRQTGVIYGDQSMFVRKAFFRRVGEFAEQGIEDLMFSDDALKHARSCLLPAEVTTDSRKFRQIGELRALAHVLSIIVRYERERRIGNERFFENYR